MNIKTLGLNVGEHVFVLERQDQVATVTKTSDGACILRGPAAVFGKENNNGRIYEEAEYLPHLEYLNKKIAKKKLLGELDHPENFDVSMGNVSHIIEKLEMDPTTRTLNIQIRLLDTPAGKIARTLVDAGVPLSISSRAAGRVLENKRVEIKKIFTYDIVTDPGFEEADLYRINESVTSGLRKITRKSVINDLKKLDIVNKYANVYRVNEDSIAFNKAIEDTNIMNDTTQYVTVLEMDKYSSIFKDQIDKMKKIFEGSNNELLGQKILDLEAKVSHLSKHNNYLALKLDKSIRHSNSIAEGVNKTIRYTNYLGQNIEKSILHTDHVAEGVNNTIKHNNYLAEMLDKSIRYSDNIAENTNLVIDENSRLNEKLRTSILYTESIAETLDNAIKYSEFLGENIESISNIKIQESVKTRKFSPKAVLDNKLNQKKDTSLVVKDYSNLLESTNTLIGTVNKQKTSQENDQNKAKALVLLSDNSRQEFLALDETKQQKVYDSLNESGYCTEKEVTTAIKKVINENVEIPKYIKNMPSEYVTLWESCDENEQKLIMTQSNTWNLNTPYQIRSFWNTRKFGANVSTQRLTESVKPAAKSKDTLGYNKDVVSKIASMIKAR